MNYFYEKKKSIWRTTIFTIAVLLFLIPFGIQQNVRAESSSNEKIYLEGTVDYDFGYEVLDLVNKERAKVGLSQLYMASEQVESANIRARECVLRYSHRRPVSADWTAMMPSGYSHVGENLAIGYKSAQAVVDAWMDSPTHRSNILGKDYNTIGIGTFIYINAVTGNTTYTCAQHFSNTKGKEDDNLGKSTSTYSISVDNDVYPMDIDLELNGESISDKVDFDLGEKADPIIKLSGDEIWKQEYVTAAPQTLEWNTGNPQIIEITGEGEINAVGIGSTTIQAVSAGHEFDKTIEVDVRKSIYFATITPIKPQRFSNERIEPDFTLTDGENVLVEGRDFEVRFSDNIYTGTGKIIISGIGDYGGERIEYFSIYDKSTVILSRCYPLFDHPFILHGHSYKMSRITNEVFCFSP